MKYVRIFLIFALLLSSGAHAHGRYYCKKAERYSTEDGTKLYFVNLYYFSDNAEVYPDERRKISGVQDIDFDIYPEDRDEAYVECVKTAETLMCEAREAIKANPRKFTGMLLRTSGAWTKYYSIDDYDEPREKCQNAIVKTLKKAMKEQYNKALDKKFDREYVPPFVAL